MMPVLGSNLESALEVTATLFANARITQGRTLLVTDGIDDLSHATDFCRRTFPLSILGVGTPEGSTIPLDFVNQPGRILRTQNGNPVIARLDETELSKAASRCYGRYERLTLGDNDVSRLLATPLPQDDESIEVEREFDSWSDMGFLVCLVLLPLILFGFRRGMFTVLLLVMLPRPGHAGIWEDLWQRSDQQAVVALRDGQPERASSLFNDLAWQAVARYRAEDFSGAADGFARTEGPEGSYNLGNAYAQNGNFQAAIEAYDKTLETQPDHEDALFNRNLAQQLLEEQEAAEQDSNSEGNNGANPEDSSQPQDGGEPQPSDNPEQDGQQADQPPDQQDADGSDPQDGDDNQRSETDQGDSNRDERQDALEQWLRRVPDDPGGLLRRKFQYETNQRLRRGDYRSRETEKIW
jgi:Ca-activated chloride channel family protein